MGSPKPSVTAASVNTEIDPESQASADEAARKAKERQQKGTTPTKTILTSGLGDEEDLNTKKAQLG